MLKQGLGQEERMKAEEKDEGGRMKDEFKNDASRSDFADYKEGKI